MKDTSIFSQNENSNTLWDKLQTTIPSKSVLRIFDGQNATVRFIGPFLPVSRKYIQQSKLWNTISPIQLKEAIYDQDSKRIDEIRGVIQALPLSVTHPATKKTKLASGLYSPEIYESTNEELTMEGALNLFNSKWTQVLFANVLVKKYKNVILDNQLIKVFELSTPFVTVLSNYPSIVINGIKAFDLDIGRTGAKWTSKWAITPSKSSTVLTRREVEIILNDGLLDIKKILHSISTESLNKKKGYLYRASEDYRMPDDISLQFNKQIKDYEEDAHADEAEAAIDDLPEDAFENKPDKPDAFSSIEIE